MQCINSCHQTWFASLSAHYLSSVLHLPEYYQAMTATTIQGYSAIVAYHSLKNVSWRAASEGWQYHHSSGSQWCDCTSLSRRARRAIRFRMHAVRSHHTVLMVYLDRADGNWWAVRSPLPLHEDRDVFLDIERLEVSHSINQVKLHPTTPGIFAFIDDDKEVIIVETDHGSKRLKLDSSRSHLEWNDAHEFWTGAKDGLVTLFDLHLHLSGPGAMCFYHPSAVNNISCHPMNEHQLLVQGLGDKLCLYDIRASRSETSTRSRFSMPVVEYQSAAIRKSALYTNALAMSTDGQFIASGLL